MPIPLSQVVHGPGEWQKPTLQRQQVDVLNQHGLPWSWSPIYPSRMVLPGRASELVRGAIRTLVGFDPLIKIHPRHQFAVEFDADPRAVARDDGMVPLAGRLHGIAAGRHEVIEGAGVVQAGARRIVNRHFDTVEPDIVPRLDLDRKCPHEDAAVAAGGN